MRCTAISKSISALVGTYVMLYVDEKDKVKGKGVNTAFTFVATTQALKVMKYYNSLATTVVDVSR